MKPEFETRLRRDARAIEREPTERMLAGLRVRLASARTPEVASIDSRSRLLVAAAVLAAAGSLAWALNRLGRQDGATPDVPSPVATIESGRKPNSTALDTFAFTNLSAGAIPNASAGLALAARASEPLEREWDHLVNDSKSVWRGLERQIPLITARD